VRGAGRVPHRARRQPQHALGVRHLLHPEGLQGHLGGDRRLRLHRAGLRRLRGRPAARRGGAQPPPDHPARPPPPHPVHAPPPLPASPATGPLHVFPPLAVDVASGPARFSAFAAETGSASWEGLARALYGLFWFFVFLAIVNSTIANANAGVNVSSRTAYAMG